MTMLGEVARGNIGSMLRYLIDGIRENQHAKVLVVGCRGDNFPEEYRDHPQLLFWEGEDGDKKDIPQAVKLVLRTRFLSHASQQAIGIECTRRGVRYINQPLGTGEIKTIIQPLMAGVHAAAKPPQAPIPERMVIVRDLPETRPSEPVAAPINHTPKETTQMVAASTAAAGKKQEKGWLTAAVRKQKPNFDVTPLRMEAERVFKAMQADGVPTTLDSVKNAVYRLRIEYDAQQRKKAIQDKRRQTLAARNGKPEPGVVTPLAVTVTPPPTGPAVTDDELVRMLDDAQAALALVRETIVRQTEARTRLRELLRMGL